MLKRTLNYTVDGVSYTAEPTGKTLGTYQEWAVSCSFADELNQAAYSMQHGTALIACRASRAAALDVLGADGHRERNHWA